MRFAIFDVGMEQEQFNMEVISDLWAFVKKRKKYWLLPLILILLLFAVIFAAAGGSAIAPFIYSLF